jgi:hypothetical protein
MGVRLFLHARYLECRNPCLQKQHQVFMCTLGTDIHQAVQHIECFLEARLVSQRGAHLEEPCLQHMEEAKKDRDIKHRPALPIHSYASFSNMTRLSMHLGMHAHSSVLGEAVTYILVVHTCNLLHACAQRT